LKIIKKPVSFMLSGLLSLILFPVLFSGCSKAGLNRQVSPSMPAAPPFSSYRDIPGVTEKDIEAIEAIRAHMAMSGVESFTYGMPPSTEAFLNGDGEVRGYAALLCEWLTEMFGISFVPKHYSWLHLLDGLEKGEVDFTGDLTPNNERRRNYFMTDAIAQRTLKCFRIAGSRPFYEISQTRLPRYLLLEKTTVASAVLSLPDKNFEPVYILENDEVYELLKSGAADALITESVHEAFWDANEDIVISDFFPLMFSPVSFSTHNPLLAPIVSVVQKALENDGIHYFYELYDRGYQEYMVHKTKLRLTDEELEFIKNHPVIPFAAEYDNYPISFYSTRYNEYQGISFDVLKQIEALTGLKFSVVNKNGAEFHELIDMLESGDAWMLSELIPSAAREERFLWPSSSFMADRSVLISRVEYPNVKINKVFFEKVGLSKETAHTEFFQRWFPDHPHAVIFESQSEAFNALMKGDVDMVMNSYSTLLYLTNYQELSGFKANVMFDNHFTSTFGMNRDQTVLCSIISKTLGLVDAGTISEQWLHKTYDYRLKVAQARMPWLIGSVILSLCVLALLAVLFVRSRRSGKRLGVLVEKRTYELALQKTMLAALLDSNPDLIFAKNTDFRYMQCNKSMLEHFGITSEDLIGKNDKDGLGVTDKVAEIFNSTDRKVIDEGEVIVFEEHIPHVDGTNPLYETIKVPLILDKKFIGVMGIARDITKRKELEESALAASRSKSAFLANMSHEIRTPMNAIMGVTEILIQHKGLPPDIEEGLSKIYSSCDLLLGIINDILDFSKIEAGKLDIIPSQYKVASMINDSAHLNMMRIGSKPIEFELQIDENVPAKLVGDELRIKQILNNLLSNAFKYTDAGRVVLSVVPEAVPGNDKEITLVLRVRDTGRGLNGEQLNKLFDEYVRFNQEKGIVVEGTGLGLGITKKLVNLMDGEIHVESEPGKGSLFTIMLPQELVDSETLGKDVVANLRTFRLSYMSNRKRSQISRDPMPYGSILVVDDVETNLYVAVGLLKLYQLHIDTAMSGKEAIQKIQSGKVYDIVFMDHMMPEMDGIETTKRLRALGYSATIVALTANAVAGQADIFFKSGFDEFISKPIDMRQLNSVLNRMVRDKYPADVTEAARRQMEESSRNQLPQAENAPQVDALLRESFMRDARKAIEWIDGQIQKAGLKGEDALRLFTVTVHGMKSSLWNIGETSIAELASKLEISGRERNEAQIAASVPAFLNDLRGLLEKLKPEPHEYGEDDDIEKLRGNLHAIKDMCAEYNRKGALDIISEIKKCSKETRAVLDKIMEYVLHSDFEEAESAAEVYAAGLAASDTKADDGK